MCHIQSVRMDYGHKIHNSWILKWIWNGPPKSIWIMDFYGILIDFQSKSVWIMDFLWIFNLNPHGLLIFMEWTWILF